MKALRALIVDDADFLRSMMREILSASDRFEIAGEARDGVSAVERFEALRPDFVAMDLVMPSLGGVEATRRILAIDPGATVVVTSAPGQEALVIDAIAAGPRVSSSSRTPTRASPERSRIGAGRVLR
jgi:two-component system chemotaxis response regulator CheY